MSKTYRYRSSYRLEAFAQWALDLTAVGDYPNFVRQPRVTPAGGLTNADYQQWIATWTTSEGEEDFLQPENQVKARMAGGPYEDELGDNSHLSLLGGGGMGAEEWRRARGRL